jgi:diguanylate cyclase (GGDEF)-like protein
MERLAIALKKGHRQANSYFAVLFIDLDDFKRINDTLGHLVGDQLLIRISQILRDSVREVDSVARLGGDEFTILLEEVQHLKEVLNIAERIQEKLKPSFRLGYQEIFTSASIGIVFSTPDYQEVADIVRDADIAMYRAKANGKGCYEVFDQAMYAQTLHWVEIENDLRYAIANQELQIYYQPIVSLQNHQKLEGFEVLLRWHHPYKGLIPASEFIPVAEDTGLINAIGEWVLQEACRQFERWRLTYSGFAALYLSINISGRQLREKSLITTLDRALLTTQIPPHCLKLEITESSLIENTQIAAQILRDIQQRGIQISLDDFGTGFSSLRYLHQFPINIIKIDRSFVETIQQGDRERSIIHSIITLARALGFATVAEGIESHHQLEQLQALECESGQGFFFSQPLSRQQLEEFLRQNHWVTVPLSSSS